MIMVISGLLVPITGPGMGGAGQLHGEGQNSPKQGW